MTGNSHSTRDADAPSHIHSLETYLRSKSSSSIITHPYIRSLIHLPPHPFASPLSTSEQMSLPVSLSSLPLKVEDYCTEFTSDLAVHPLDLTPGFEHATEIDRPRRPSVSSVGTVPSPISPTFLQSSQDESDDCWNLIPYNVPWGNNYHNYEYGTLPGPEGACIFLRSPTPVKNQRTSQACKKCRERKAKCSGTRPSCERCIARGHTCVYVDDPKRVRRSTSNTSLCHRSSRSQSRSVSRRASSQSIMAEPLLDETHCSSPRSSIMSGLQLEPDSEPEFPTAVEFNHETSYDGEFSSVIQLPETPYALSIQSASLDSPNPPPGSVHSPQPMRYPQLGSLLSISIPGTDEIPALESTSSSPASTSSQSTPLLDYQSGVFENGFVPGEFGYDRSAQFQAYCASRSVQFPQFDHISMPMGCSFENSHQVYTIGGSGDHLLASTEGYSHPYNEDLLVRPQFVPY